MARDIVGAATTIPPAQPSVQAATADLERLQQLLLRATRGDIELIEVRESLEKYWNTYGTVLAGVAASSGDEVRLRTLQELYKWHEHLAQLQQARTSESDSIRRAEH
jgi:hypothetical protein